MEFLKVKYSWPFLLGLGIGLGYLNDLLGLCIFTVGLVLLVIRATIRGWNDSDEDTKKAG